MATGPARPVFVGVVDLKDLQGKLRTFFIN